MDIRNIKAENYKQLAAIYLQGIATGFATFQTEAASWEAWDKSHMPSCRIAMFDNDDMIGWAALSPVSSRIVYAGVAEVNIYVAENCRRRGIGKLLLMRLIQDSEMAGLWTLQSGIFPTNHGSINLHKNCGFRIVGTREKIGQKDGVWTDNIIMERRSKIVGV